jgi:methyl-accepting chemotaxis protein
MLYRSEIAIDTEPMTENWTERWTEETLDRFAASVATAIAANNAAIAANVELTKANAEAIAANAEAIAAGMEELTAVTQAISRDLAHLIATQQAGQQAAEQERAELRQATLGIANLLASLDEDRPTILRKLNAIENKVDRLLEK